MKGIETVPVHRHDSPREGGVLADSAGGSGSGGAVGHLGARISTDVALTWLPSGGFTFPITDWDDASFVHRYLDISANGRAGDDATCFLIPHDGRYRLGFGGYLRDSTGNLAHIHDLFTGDSAMEWWVDSPNAYWTPQSIFGQGASLWYGVPTGGTLGNIVQGGMTFYMDVVGFAGDIWIPETYLNGPADDVLGAGGWASIEKLR